MKNQYVIKGDYVEVLVVSKKHGEYKVIIDTEDLPRLMGKTIGLSSINPNGDAYFHIWDKNKQIYLHRFLLGCFDSKLYIDHIDRNTCNNRRSNLRAGSSMQNQQNRFAQKNSTTGIKGVFYYPTTNKWQARLKMNGRWIVNKLFDTKEEAIKARQDAELQYHEWSPLQDQ